MKLVLRVETGSLAGQEFPLEGEALRIGRDPACEVRFAADQQVSRRHAVVSLADGQFVVADTQSTNGTLVNGDQVERGVLRGGDLIQLGSDGPRLRVVIDGVARIEEQETKEIPKLAEPPQTGGEPPEASPEPTRPSPRPAGVEEDKAPAKPSLLDSGIYDPTQDKGRRYSVLSLVVVFGMMFAGAFLGFLIALMSVFNLGFKAALVGVLVAFTPAPLYLAIWLWLDRNDPEPAWILAAALVWGGGAATFVSAIVNDLFQGVMLSATGSRGLASLLSGSISAPFIEEGTKALAVLLIFLFLRKEFDGVIDGIVYAGVVALGFATVENVLYYGRAMAKGGASMLAIVFVLRGILGPFGHAVYTSMTGIGLGVARQTHNTLLRVAAPVAGYGAAVFLHSLWNTLAGLTTDVMFLAIYLVFWVPLFLAFFGIVIWMGFRESKLIRKMLELEVARGLLTTDQADLVASWTRRLGWQLASLGDFARLRARREYLYSATRLALCYWHVERAQAAGGMTMSFGQIPQFQREVKRLREQV